MSCSRKPEWSLTHVGQGEGAVALDAVVPTETVYLRLIGCHQFFLLPVEAREMAAKLFELADRVDGR